MAHNIYEHRAIKAAEIVAQIIVDDLQKMLINDSTRPLHERLADYIGMSGNESLNKNEK